VSNLEHIKFKLQKFIIKFYLNELIRGTILFFTIGLLYLFFTVFIEFNFWLKPFARFVLFGVFILVEVILLFFYILLPIFKIMGFKKGISEIEASYIIGKYFSNVSDKLLNTIQLSVKSNRSELLEASIEQKSKDLQLIPFRNAINFSTNIKFLKFALIPVLVWLLVYLFGMLPIFSDSFLRVVHYNTQFEEPADFSFVILNKSLDVIEGGDLKVSIETLGDIFPVDAKIYFLNENYYLENDGPGKFEYTFSNLKESFDFYIESNNVLSKMYQINVLKTPVISNIKMVLEYPSYINRKSEVVVGSGNVIVPQGTLIKWQVESNQTESISYKSSINVSEEFVRNSKKNFSFSKKFVKTTSYEISTSNESLKNYESLQFLIEVKDDEFPKIVVHSNIDSLNANPIHFMGQLSDDFGLNELKLIYYNKNESNELESHNIEISKGMFSDFFYVFPESLSLQDGMDYEMYFEIYDNDAVNGRKKAKSRVFSYYNKTEGERKNEFIESQNEIIDEMKKGLDKSKDDVLQIKKLENAVQKKSGVDWNDKKMVEDFILRQNRYNEMFREQTNSIENKLKELKIDKKFQEKTNDLEERIKENKELLEQNKLMEELKELTDKLDKDELVSKLKEFSKKSKRKQQSLERLVELMKRFYVEQKLTKIQDEIFSIGTKEDELSKKNVEDNSVLDQLKINQDFDDLKKDFELLKKDNESLNRPIKFPIEKEELDDIGDELLKALDNLKLKNFENGLKHQKNAAKMMKNLSLLMEKSSMNMNGEMIDEDIDDLRKIIENLIEFSFQQENLLEKINGSSSLNSDLPSSLKRQNMLKEYFYHIDDSLYVLSLRLVKMGSIIQKEVSNVHYYLDESLVNFSDSNLDLGMSNQHFVINSSNILANSLSDLLQSMMNASPSFGDGKGNSQEFSLPDIIKKQGDLLSKMKQESGKGGENGNKKTGKGEEENGDGKGNRGEGLDDDIYNIYKEQVALRESLNDLLEMSNDKLDSNADDVFKQMEEIEKELLEKGFSSDVVNKMEKLNYELLKFDKAKKEQGEDTTRKSKTNNEIFNKRIIDKVKFQNQYFNYNEILNRQSLPLRTIYKKKVQEYFKKE